jgi:hypothetical protein
MLVVLTLGQLSAAGSVDDFSGVLPSEIDGWKKADNPITYDQKTLYEYIDGGAELYIAYDFRKLYAFRYTSGDDAEIVIDIFDMGNSYDAFGVFSHGREVDDKTLGQGSEYNSGLLTFWKERYYVSILAYPETEQKAKIVQKLGRLLADSISATGDIPPVVSLLPEEGLVEDSIHYFHHPILVNSHYFIATDNILDIGGDTPSVLAKYDVDGRMFYMLLVHYPDESKARSAQESFLTHFLQGSRESILKSAEGTWTGCRRKGGVLVVVFNSPTREILESYLERAAADRS